MIVHLDTSFLIRALVRGSAQDAELRRWLKAGTQVCMSTIAWAELLCGPMDETAVRLATCVVTDRLPFSEDDAALAADLFNRSGRRRGSLADCMIAAVAVRAQAALATMNGDDFQRFAPHGLELTTV